MDSRTWTQGTSIFTSRYRQTGPQVSMNFVGTTMVEAVGVPMMLTSSPPLARPDAAEVAGFCKGILAARRHPSGDRLRNPGGASAAGHALRPPSPPPLI